MNERRTDFDLLRDFARHGNESAFADVVRRHLDLVYTTALRKVEDPGAAEEVAQNVFITLARKAWQFAPDDSLPAWLYKATLLEARQWLRGELRRRRREQTAAELGTTMKTPDEQTAFQALLPLLDEALLSLREKDRTALLLRFHEHQTLRELGSALGVSEDTAQKRVATALDKLAQFFQRRGFRTATTAATTAALQHTSATASAATASAIVNAALQSAPPALGGLGAILSRLASLSKAKAAALSTALVVLPVAWQFKAHEQAGKRARIIETQLLAAQTEQETLQAQIEQLRASSNSLNESILQASAAAARAAAAAREFEAWKARIRAELASADYHWPEDSPFVRIPKSALSQTGLPGFASPPGVVSRAARELLGLTPREREQVEDALHAYYANLDNLIDSEAYETNRVSHFNVPDSALAREAWAVPALGDTAKSSAQGLEATLRGILGDQRWALVERRLNIYGTDTLRRVLDLDAAQQSQELAAWIYPGANGKLMAGFGWGSFNSGAFSNSGVPLEGFLPGAVTASGRDPRAILLTRQLPLTLSQKAISWLEQQAVSRLGKESGQ